MTTNKSDSKRGDVEENNLDKESPMSMIATNNFSIEIEEEVKISIRRMRRLKCLSNTKWPRRVCSEESEISENASAVDVLKS